LTLLFSSTEDPSIVFSLPLQEQIFDVKNVGALDDNKVAIPLIDLSKVTFPADDENEISVGGRVTSMDWDPLGKYLAIIFQVLQSFTSLVLSMFKIIEYFSG
jgi:hypothetical protein